MKRVILPVLLILIVGLGVFFGLSLKKPESAVRPMVKEAQVQTIAAPQRLIIPKLDLTAKVESVGLDQQGRMDVPKIADDVGWYDLGSKPGEKGNAVIDGHFDKVTGAAAVFYNLNKLTIGDQVITKDAQGQQYTFVVVRKTSYPYNQFPLQEVFGPSQVPQLNLITCNGTWDKTKKNYSERIVIFARLIK